MKSTITSLLIAVAASAAASVVTTTPVHAETEYAWCAFVSTQGGSQSCTFSTHEQCRAYVAGSGFCQSNPRATPFAEMPKRAPRVSGRPGTERR